MRHTYHPIQQLHNININPTLQQLPDNATIKILKAHKIWHTDHDKRTDRQIRRKYQAIMSKSKSTTEVKSKCTKLPKIVNVNARSLKIDTRQIDALKNNNKVETLNALLQDGTIDLVCITESWLNENKKPSLQHS